MATNDVIAHTEAMDTLNEQYMDRCSDKFQVGDFIESVQAAIVAAGGSFQSRFNLEKETLEGLNHILSKNSIVARFIEPPK